MTLDNQNLSYRLEELERRWAQSPDRTVLLQLAEEYGRHGRWRDAARVLSDGLEQRPNHISARVALGRVHLRSGYAAEACAELEKVVSGDPMHLVANKLLVEAYLDTGQIQRSRDRLDLYALLAGSDPDIDRLEHEVSQSEQGVPRAPVVAQEAAPQQAAPQEEPLAADVTPAAPVVPAQSAAVDIAAAPSAAMSGVAVQNPGQTSVPGEPVTGPVFPGAGQLGGEALGLQQLAPAGVVERPKHGFFGGTAEDPFAALLGDNGGSVGGGEGSALPTSDGTQETGVLFALGSGAVGAGVTVVASALAASEPTAVSDPGSPEVPDVESTPPAAAFDGFESGTNVQTDSEAAPATVTLGRLYLAQGHAKRAEDVFGRVLEREPNNAEARAGLAEARSDGDPRLTADMLLGEQSDSLGSRDKKKALLTRYLDRIRASETRLSGLSTE